MDGPQTPGRRRAAFICAALSLIGVLLPWTFSGSAQTSDFGSYYVAGKLVLNQPARLYSIGLQHSEQAALHMSKFLPWAHPALEALIFAPLSLMPLQTAFRVWGVVNLTLLCLIAYMVRKYLAQLSVWEGYSVFACSLIPLGAGLAQGQDHILVLLIYSASSLMLLSEKDLAGGLILGLALIRFQLTLPVLLCFLSLRRWRVIGGAMISSAALLISSFAIIGVRFLRSYRSILVYLGTYHDAFSAPDMPSIRGLTAILMPHSEHLLLITAIISSLFLVGAVWLWTLQRYRPISVLLASAMLIALAVDYHSFLYEVSLIALPALFLVTRNRRFAYAFWLCGAFQVALIIAGGQFGLLAPVIGYIGMLAIPRGAEQVMTLRSHQNVLA